MGVYTRRKSSVTQNNLPLDVSRTKELIVDFQTKGGKDIPPPSTSVEQQQDPVTF